MKQQNKVVLIEREKLDEIKPVAATVVGEEPLQEKEPANYSQMSLAQMISYQERRIRDAEQSILKIKERIKTRKSTIKDLRAAKEKIDFLQ